MSRFFIVVIICILAGLYFFEFKSDRRGSTDQSSLVNSSQINQHLLDTQLKMDLQKKQIEQEQLTWDQIFTKTKAQLKEKMYLTEEELYKQINPEKSTKSYSVAERIQNELFNEDFSNAYDETLKSAIAQEFIKNANQAGYSVQLDDQYRVMKVGKLKQEKPFALFEPRSPQSEAPESSGEKKPEPGKEPLK
jgi:hypothetical protein